MRLRRLFASLVIALNIAWLTLSPVPAQAQAYDPPSGTKGWCTVVGPGMEECFGSPAAACHRQWEVYGEPWMPPVAYAGPDEGPSDRDVWYAKDCNWYYFASPGPAATVFYCDGFSYVRVAPGRCVLESENLTECGSDEAPNFSSYPAPCSPRPIQLLSGSKTFHETDFENASQTLRIDRHFNSFAGGGSPATRLRSPLSAGNWTFGFSVELQLTANLSAGIITVAMPGGATLAFQKQTDGSLAPYATSQFPLVRTDFKLELNGSWPSPITSLTASSSTWTLRSPQAEWTLSTRLDPVSGKYLVATPDTYVERQGPTWTFAYGSLGELESLTDQFGNSLTFAWLIAEGGADHATALSEIQLPSGYSLRYSYQDIEGGALAPDRLTLVEWLDAMDVVQDSRSYLYEDDRYPTFVTEIQDRDAVGRQFVDYQEDGKAVRSSAALGAEETTVAYGATSTDHTREVTTPLGREVTYEFAKLSWVSNNTILSEISEAASANAPASSQSFGSTGLSLTSQIDAEGRVTTFARDALGRATQIVEANGTADERTTDITWDSTFNVPTQIVQPGLTTDLTYDADGRPLTRTLTDTTTHTVPYSTNGRTRVWTYDWTADGLLETVDGPLSGGGDTVSYSYTAEGYLESTNNEVGHVTTITAHDWRGAPLTVEDENGVETDITYDIRGRPLTITVDPGVTQSVFAMEYDAAGNVTKLTLPGGGWTDYAYDAASRLTGIENDRGETQTFTVNEVGQPLTQTVRNASRTITLQQAQSYDELARLIEAIGAGSQTWALAYDKVDNLTQVTDARAEVWTNSWDSLNRIVSETDPESAEVEYAYAPNSQLIEFEDGRDLATTRIVDGFGLTISETSPDSGERTYWYDAANRMIQLVDADGVETDYTYDDAGRPLTQTFVGASGETITYAYDGVTGGNRGIGRLTGVTDASGTTALVYDAQGRVVGDARVIGAETYALAYGYNTNGDVISITYPSGHVITYARDPDGLITDVFAQEALLDPTIDIVTDVTYLPFGPVKHLTFGNGLSLLNNYDLNAWLTGIEVSSLATTTLDLSFDRDDNGGLTTVVDNGSSGRAASFGYTDSGRLQYAVGAWGDNSFSYDAAGNRTEVRTDDGIDVTYEFAVLSSTSNQVIEVRDKNWDLVRELTYRDGGDLSAQSFAGGSDFDYAYSATKRVVELEEDAVTTATYAHDFAGRRVARALLGSSDLIHYVFDAQGRLLAEHDGSTGDMIREYVWLDDTPIALIADVGGTPELYFIHMGQIGEPLAVTDVGQTTVWNAAIDPWGQATMLASPLGDLNLRLPGQSFQLESGLHQNWMRDYDPSLARYIQADPLGLEAGQNVYGYVDGDPLNMVDPTGEIGIVGAFAGAGLDLALQLAVNRGRLECVSWTQVGLAGAFGAVGVPAFAGRFAISAGRGANAWKASNAVRRFRRANNVPPTHDVHHWAIPRRFERLGGVARRIVNSPWNLHPIVRGSHRRVHSTSSSLATRWNLGAPNWSKAGQLSLGGGAAADLADQGCGCQ